MELNESVNALKLAIGNLSDWKTDLQVGVINVRGTPLPRLTDPSSLDQQQSRRSAPFP